MDAQQNVIPIAWYLTNKSTAASLALFLGALSKKARELQPDFNFSCALVDDDSAEHAAIRYVQQPLHRLLADLSWRLVSCDMRAPLAHSGGLAASQKLIRGCYACFCPEPDPI